MVGPDHHEDVWLCALRRLIPRSAARRTRPLTIREQSRDCGDRAAVTVEYDRDPEGERPDGGEPVGLLRRSNANTRRKGRQYMSIEHRCNADERTERKLVSGSSTSGYLVASGDARTGSTR